MKNYVKIQSARYPDVILRAVPGHFITPHAHVNYYLDFTPLKFRSSEAHAAAKALSSVHNFSTPVDTIIALEGTEIIAGYLADELTQAGVLCKNAHKSIYVIPPEYSSEGQLIFRDSLLPWIKEKNVLLLFSAITTGSNAAQAIESLRYYGASITGISALFSLATSIAGMTIYSIFSQQDLPDYKAFSADKCGLCESRKPVDAICNGFGYTMLKA